MLGSLRTLVFFIAFFSFHSVFSQTVTVDEPVGGETFNIDAGIYIEWTATGFTTAKVEYSVNGGSSWTVLSSNENAGTGYMYWIIPSTPSTNCLVRVSDASNSATNDVCDFPFTINPPSITVEYPNGGEIWGVGTTQYIYWDSPGVPQINIQYSTDYGSTWKPVVSNYNGSTGYYAWLIPNDISSEALVKISDASNAALFDISDFTFTIPAPYVDLTDPDGGENWGYATNQYIIWDSESVQNVKLEYSTDSGSTWNTIISSTSAASQYYLWSVPNTPSTKCLVRATDASNPAVGDTSIAVFTIVGPTIEVTDPDGFEIWNAGSNHYITWNGNGFTNVDIDLSIDNGLTWTSIVTNQSNIGYYYWNVPNMYSNQCRVRVSSSADPGLFDVSDDPFTIPAPSLEVDQPNGFDVWGAGTNKYIYWTSASVDSVDLHYSFDNGLNWVLIADSISAFSGYYYWTVPATYSTTCLMKVSQTGNPSLFDISDAVWTIPAPSIEVTTPNGGESWSAFTNHYIYWSAPSVASVKIEYSADNGSSWNLIANNVNGSIGYYLWNVPYTPSTSCLVRVTDVASNLVYDVSNAVFTIPMPSLSITSPVGGESWSVGTSRYISWGSSSVSEVTIEYSTNNGVSWNLIDNSADGPTGYYYWTVPNTPSPKCLVRLTDNLNTQIVSQSPNVFTIPQPAIAVTVPNGGERWGGGSSHYIQWVSPSVQNVKIEYTLNNGGSWNILTPSTPAANGAFQWTVPFTPATQCMVKISDAANSTLSDVSDSLFVIPQASVKVLSPNGGEVWSVNTTKTITWESNTITNVKIEYTKDNGLTWNTIVSSVSALSGYYNWSVPLNAVGTCKVRISEIGNPSVNDVSDNSFTISGPSITLTAPVGGETLVAGSAYYITWSSNGILHVKLEYTTDNESSWTTIHPGLTNYDYYYWNVPANINSSTCKIRVTSTLNSALTSKSAANFSITPSVASLQVITPNGGETFYTGNSYYINWTSTAVNNVKIEYTLDNLLWQTITASTPSSNGFYYWNVPATPSLNARVRISDAANATVKDVSDTTFTIALSTPSVTVTSPNGGESWYAGSYHSITWNSNNIPAVDVSYSIDNGVNWISIANNVTDNFIYWYVPSTISPTCLVRVSSTGPLTVSDQSDSVFAIITSPPNNNVITTDSITPSVFCKQDTIKVYYTATGVYNSGNIFTAQISDSLGSFAYPKVIGSNASPASGYVTCVIPAYITNGNLFRIRVVSDDLPAIGTLSDTLTLNSPVFNFSGNDLNKYLPDGLVNFTFTGAPAQSYLWDFGDGNTSTVQSPSHTYNNIGYKTVSLQAVNVNGCALTVTKPFYVRVERLLPNVPINTNTVSDITGISFSNDTTGCISTMDGNCLVTFNGGDSWNAYPTGVAGLTSALWINASNVYVTGPNGAILKSVNGGQSWSSMTTGTTETINSIGVQRTNTRGYAVGSNGKVLTVNGTSWTNATSGTSANLRSVAISGTGKATAAGDNGTVLRTTDYGSTWNTVNPGVTNNLKQVTFADTLTGYIAAENGIVLLSVDGGTTWNVTLAGVDVSFSSVAVSRTGDTAWAASNSGVIYRTTNRGQSWGRYSKGSTNDNTNATYRTSRGYITGKGGDLITFEGDLDSAAIGVRELMNSSELFVIYPNPASASVTIDGQCESCHEVSVSVYDMHGRLVIPVKTESVSGMYRKVIPVQHLEAGVYFIHIESDVNSTVHRVVIAR